MSKATRFRAYQLGSKGSSFTYSVDNHITLIEARFNETNCANVLDEVKRIGNSRLDCLHITSWDEDHCNYPELKEILKYLKPYRIEYPWYAPETDNGLCSKYLIEKYVAEYSLRGLPVSPDYINSLEVGQERMYNDILYNPTVEAKKPNDNSLVKFFRQGRFTVLSLGDCEDPAIAKRIMRCSMARSEVDVMIIAHHGADNGFTTKEFIDIINPKVAVCSSNYDNQFEHPKPEIRQILHEVGIPLYTTKTGDIIVDCPTGNTARVFNFIGNNELLSSSKTFTTKLSVPDKI